MATAESCSSKMDQNVELTPPKEPFRRQGSVRRVVHSDKDQPMIGVCAKMVERTPSSQPYAPFIQEYCIISEFNMVGDHHIPGLYVIPSAKSAMIWFGVLFIRSGPYKGGVFRFNLLLPEGFPGSTAPRVIFEKEIFHPNIEPGSISELNLEVAFRDWKKDVNHIWQVLEYTRAVFYSIDTKSTVNSEALSMYVTGNEEFDRRAREAAEDSMRNIYEVPTIEDEHYFRFEEYREEIHKDALLALTKAKVKDEALGPRCRGLSWVRKGTLQPFSKLVR